MSDLGVEPQRDPFAAPRAGRGVPGSAAGMVVGVGIALAVLALIAYIVITALG